MYDFCGVNWTELSDAFGIVDGLPEWEKNLIKIYNETEDPMGNCREFNNDFEEWVLLHNTRHYIAHSIGSEREAEVANTIREFLKALYNESKEIDYWYTIWKGLLEVEDNATLLRATCYLLPVMWS